MGWITSALAIAKSVFDLLTGRQRRREREEYRKAGRDEQRAADLSARESQASEANAIDEDVRGMSRADIERELRNPD